jgi:hypothetical protein
VGADLMFCDAVASTGGLPGVTVAPGIIVNPAGLWIRLDGAATAGTCDTADSAITTGSTTATARHSRRGTFRTREPGITTTSPLAMSSRATINHLIRFAVGR